MKIIEVIQARRWKNKITGETASITGAAPYFGSDGSDWTIEIVGWTWRLSNGTIGLGRMPAKTKREAEEVMTKFNKRQATMTKPALDPDFEVRR